MNTDETTHIDLAAVWVALGMVSEASSRQQLCIALERLAKAVGMQHFLLLHLHADSEIINAWDNLASPLSFESTGVKTVSMSALTKGIIPKIVKNTGIEGMQHAISSMRPCGGVEACVLLLGGDAPIDANSEVELLGIASLASSYIDLALAQLQKADCPLTSRELECLTFIAAGSSAKETSRHLRLSPRTVEEYLSRCRVRLEVKTSLAAIAMAVRHGWITYDEIDAASASISCPSAASPMR